MLQKAIGGLVRVGRSTVALSSLIARNQIESLRIQQAELHHRRISAYGFSAFSQNDEDGILQEIFQRIGTTTKTFIEFGCGDGLANNTLYLLFSGWSGVWIDGGADKLKSIRRKHRSVIECGALIAEQRILTAENINETLSTLSKRDVDLLSIDIDGNDYWVWRALTSILPRVVAIEYNAVFRPPIRIVQKYCPTRSWDQTNYFGASLKALEMLGKSKGYALVACNLTGVNAFFVREDCLNGQFHPPFTAENLYMPANYKLFSLAKGTDHPVGIGDYDLNPELAPGEDLRVQSADVERSLVSEDLIQPRTVRSWNSDSCG